MEKLQYLLKRTWKVFLYSHFATFMTLMLSISAVQFFVDMDSDVGRIIFEILVFLFWVFVMGLVGMAFGGRQYKHMKNNEYRRNPDSPDFIGFYEDKHNEYAPFNGFLLGLLGHYPLFILQLLYVCGMEKTFALIMGYSAVVSSPLYEFVGSHAVLLSLVLVPVSMLVTGAGYLLARAKIRVDERKISAMENALNDKGDNE
ncbi:MAG: hypothetical protein IKC56_03060 [Clostridia bacterium]|nr:hypothetical protein [Clostridia bacterium]